MRRILWVPVAWAAACSPPPAPTSSLPPPIIDAAPPMVVDASTIVEASAPALVAAPVVPPLPPLEKGMMDHARFFGFSDDGKTLGYCGVFGGKPIVRCGTRTNGQSKDEVRDDDSRGAALVAWTKGTGIGKKRESTWPYGDLEITWSATTGDPNKHKPGSLDVGVRVKGKPAAMVLHFSGAWYLDRWHPELIGLSPDGSTLGAIAHGFGGEYSDTFVIDTIATNVAAGRAYLAAGQVERAHEVDPTLQP